MKKLLATIAIMTSIVGFATPAQADTCLIGPVCIPTLPQLPAPVPVIPQPPTIPGLPPVVIPTPPAVPQTPVTPAPHSSAPVQPAPPAVESVPQNRVNPPNPVTPPATTPPSPGTTGSNTTTPCAPVAKPVPSKPVVKTRYITIGQAVSLSLGFLALGALLVLLALYIMYRIGKREAEANVNEFMAELMTLAVRNPKKKS